MCWQWSQHLHRQCLLAGKEPIQLNLDETSVPLVFTKGKGNIVVEGGARAWRRTPVQKYTRGEQRMAFTHVGIICDRPEIQPLLPHVIFVAAKNLRLAEWTSLLQDLPSNVYVKRMPKAWNNSQQHCVIIRILGLILRPFLSTLQPMLSFDAARIHLHADVLHELRLARIWYYVIPARLTWMLQPCDTHAFVLYKRWLRRAFQDRGPPSGGVSLLRQMLGLVIGAIRHVLQGHRWRKAWEQNGLGPDMSMMSSFVREQCGPLPLPPPLAVCPTPAELRLCWPRNQPFDAAVVTSGIPGVAPAGPALLDADIALAPEMALLALPEVEEAPPLLALEMDVAGVSAADEGAPLVEVVHPPPLPSSSSVAALPRASHTRTPRKRLFSRTSFEMED